MVNWVVDRHNRHVGWINVSTSRQPWGSWEACLSASPPHPPIFVTWNAAYWCIIAQTDVAIIHPHKSGPPSKRERQQKWPSLKLCHKSGHHYVQSHGPFLRIHFLQVQGLAILLHIDAQCRNSFPNIANVERSGNKLYRLYSNKSSKENDVDLVQMRLFSQTTTDVERITQLKDAFDHHPKRSVFEANIWETAHMSMMPLINSINHGWKEEDGKLLPIWTTLPLAKDVFHLNVKCTCPITCSQCKCVEVQCKRQGKCACETPRSSWTGTISNTSIYIGALVNLLAIFWLNVLFRDLF